MSKKILIFPFGGNAREAVAALLAINDKKKQWNILGFLDDNSKTWKQDCCGVKVLGGQEILEKYPQAQILAVPGNPDNYRKRKSIIEGLSIAPKRFASIIHPAVQCAPDVQIGVNTLIMTGAVLGPGAKIGNHCIILPNTVVGHDVQIEDYTCIGANVTISGQVVIKTESYIGSGSCLKEHVVIGKRSLVGLGSNVIHDVEKETIVAGNPARLINGRG